MKQKLKVYLETSFVSYLTGRPTTREPVASWRMETMRSETFESPIDEIYRIRQEISAEYDHDPQKLFVAMVAKQRERARQGHIFWGYNAAGELAPLPMESVCGEDA